MFTAILASSVLLFQSPPSQVPNAPNPVVLPSTSPDGGKIDSQAPAATVPERGASGDVSDAYILGPGDQIVIRVPDAEEIGSQPVPLDMGGFIDIPYAGRVKATGLTTEELGAVIQTRLKKYFVHPDVSIWVSAMKSHTMTVSIIGAVQQPGLKELPDEKSLFEIISIAGGLRQDAGDVVKITRKLQYGRIPLSGAADDPTGQFSIASVNVKGILNAENPADNIIIKPDDFISVAPADIIYAVGNLKRPGGYALGSNHTLSALQILSLAGGFDHAPKESEAKIMRPIPGSSDHTEIPLDLKKMLAGKISDVPLQANDILFVPTSTAKLAAFQTIQSLITVGTYSVYRIP